MARKANHYISDIAFTPAVKALQVQAGSRSSYARMEQGAGWQTCITNALADFIAEQTSIFLATVNTKGQPYIQHRGGPRGFLHVLDEQTIAFADYSGNRQYITTGNLVENNKAHMFLIDYMKQQRVKVWGELCTVENDPALFARLMPIDYRVSGERAMIFSVTAWDANCSQHIPQRFDAANVKREFDLRDLRIAVLEEALEQYHRSES